MSSIRDPGKRPAQSHSAGEIFHALRQIAHGAGKSKHRRKPSKSLKAAICRIRRIRMIADSHLLAW
jgi:hypothetical protein